MRSIPATTAKGQRFVAAKLVGQLEKDLGVAFQIEVAVGAPSRPIDLQSLDGGQLVRTTSAFRASATTASLLFPPAADHSPLNDDWKLTTRPIARHRLSHQVPIQ